MVTHVEYHVCDFLVVAKALVQFGGEVGVHDTQQVVILKVVYLGVVSGPIARVSVFDCVRH